MQRILAITLALLVITITGCQTDDGATTPTDATTPLLDAPAESGIIVRDSQTIAFTSVDARTGLRSVVGIPFNDFCAGIPNFSIVDWQWIFTPAGNDVVHFFGDDVYVEIWPLDEPFNCANMAGMDPIASGFVHYVRTDNDYLVDGVDNTNAYGWLAQGELFGPDGTSYRYSEVVRLQIPVGGSLDSTPIVRFSKITLR